MVTKWGSTVNTIFSQLTFGGRIILSYWVLSYAMYVYQHLWPLFTRWQWHFPFITIKKFLKHSQVSSRDKIIQGSELMSQWKWPTHVAVWLCSSGYAPGGDMAPLCLSFLLSQATIARIKCKKDLIVSSATAVIVLLYSLQHLYFRLSTPQMCTLWTRIFLNAQN